MDTRLKALWFSQLPGPTTNPYVTQLVESLSPDVDITFFSWQNALLSRYDLAHVHWPEIKLQGSSRLIRTANRALFALLLLRLTILRTPVVRTLHNLDPHEGVSRVDKALLGWLEQRTAMWIRLGEHTPAPRHGLTVTIPHGHYMEWFSPFPRATPFPGRVAFVGLIRPYKGVDDLMVAFGNAPGDGLSLRVCGRVQDDALETRIRDLAGLDRRVGVDLSYISDAQMVTEVTQAQLIALPYRELHNSGALLLALSLGRPVLVPSTHTTEAVAAEVGQEWVVTYSGELTPIVLMNALTASTPLLDASRAPDLSARDWDLAGSEHLAAYEAAVTSVGRRYSA